MRIGISGAGVAGPTLAWWLLRCGHEPVLFEESEALRTGGYIIDFWGVGYGVAERMGILPELRERGYLVESLRLVNRRGGVITELGTGAFREMLGGRFLSIARGDIAATIFRACEGVETRFARTIEAVEQREDAVRVRVSDGTEESFDLLIGADGLHSRVRELVFGPEREFERFLGFRVAAFTCAGYEPRNELVYVTYAEPGRHIARFALRDGRTMFLLVFREALLDAPISTREEVCAALRGIFGSMGWEADAVLARLDDAEDLYFDRVSQIRMDRWSQGRVALIGDAATCVSLLAGEGTGLAMAGAYTLAGELCRSGGDHVAAFGAFERRLRAELARKQRAALGFAGYFAPRTALGIFTRNMLTRAAGLPVLGKALLKRTVDDRIELAEYGM
ncbi:MAG: FAD-binding domain [Phycisphaeraceae bacterium]|nr:FAD-binding domain [Phycisphaeraceae bacterium]